MNRIPPSELILNADGSVYHLHLSNEHIADRVILVGDPGRVEQVSGFFDTIELRKQNREFVAATGSYRGKRFTVLSTGIGTDNIDIVVNELDAAVNIDPLERRPREQKRRLDLIRIGTSGALTREISVDSFIVSEYGLGFDGLLYYYQYKPTDKEIEISNNINQHLKWDARLAKPYITAAHPALAERFARKMRKGITATATGFYGPQGRQLRLTLENEQMHQLLQSFNHHGLRITNFEMETSALYGLGKMLGHRCCTCCAVIANRVTKEYSKNYKLVVNELIEQVLQDLTVA